MAQIKRWRQRLGDLKNAAGRLQEALGQNHFTDLEKDGVIQRFEFTFELTWKTLKDYLEDQGFTDVDSPKKAIQEAYGMDLIENDESWMGMLGDRNLTSHLYDQAVSSEIFRNISDKYIEAINLLIGKLEKS